MLAVVVDVLRARTKLSSDAEEKRVPRTKASSEIALLDSIQADHILHGYIL